MFIRRSFKLPYVYKKLINCRVLYSTKPFDSGAPHRAKPEEIPKGIWAEEADSPYTSVEEVKDHWQYVERLFPKLRVPDPPKKISDAGWKASAENVPDLPYFVARTRNHMLPVYEGRYYKDKVLVTYIGKVHGDIWQFEYDLKTYLEEKFNEKVESHVIEIACRVQFKGNRVEVIKDWLYNKGF